MDTKGPSNTVSERYHFNYVIVDHFSNYIFSIPTSKINVHHAVNLITDHWIQEFGPPENLITVRGTEYLDIKCTNCCTLFNIKTSPKNSHAPRKNGPVEVQNKIWNPSANFVTR